MPELFGVDIAQEIADAFDGQLVTGTLTKRTAGTRTSGNLTGGTNYTEASFSFNGFLDNKEDVVQAGTLVVKGGQYVVIIAQSLNSGNTVPEPKDKITIEGQAFEIVDVPRRDPAAATFTCKVES